MELVLDNSKTYAVALQGGGAKGAYEVGAWRALEEAGIKYKAVSGTSVGALNGAMMAMRDLERAAAAWNGMELSKVIDLGSSDKGDFKRLVSGDLDRIDIRSLAPQLLELMRNRGLDAAPLRSWLRQEVDAKRIRESDVELYTVTLNLSERKGVEVKLNELSEDEIYDMLLASSYHPSFRLEPLGGKYYADGGLVDNLPIHVLVKNGWKDIIAIRMPGLGIERLFKIPDDVNVTYIETREDLGGVLNFDSDQSRRDMKIGYLDAKRVLYGLYGKRYYIDRTLTDQEALNWLFLCYLNMDDFTTLRNVCEVELPRLAHRLGVEGGDYYELMIAVMEDEARRRGVDNLQLFTDMEFIDAINAAVPEV